MKFKQPLKGRKGMQPDANERHQAGNFV
jgi:hypothetical protein